MDTVVHGVVLGLVYGVLAAGLVLVFRTSRVVNFAHGQTGALGAAVLAKLVLDEHWPTVTALAVVLALGGGIGALTQVAVARPLRHRPRLVLLVATIGLTQVLIVAQLLLPDIKEVAPYPALLHRQVTWGSVVLTGRDFFPLAAVPAIVVALALWLTRTPSGRALRAVGDNGEAAELAGIRTGRVELIAWTVAGVVATATAVLANPLQGVIVGRPTESLGAGLMVRALAAGLVGRLRSIPLALAGGVAVGLMQAVANTAGVDPAIADVFVLAFVLAAVLTAAPEPQPRRIRRGVRAVGTRRVLPGVRDLGGRWVLPGVRDFGRRWVSPGVRDLGDRGQLVAVPPPSRLTTSLSAAGIAASIGAAAAPLVLARSSQLFSFSRIALYAIVGLSLVILTGWAGQLSLGQFALAGVGTFSAAVLERNGVPFAATVPAAAILGAAVSVVIGLPALRVRGLELAVTTLAFSVACATWVFTRRRLLDRAGLATVTRTRLIHSPRTFYAACVAALAIALVTATAIRKADLGRRLLAVRSNERRANTIGVSATVTKVTAFAIAGAFAASAGALLGALRVHSSPGDFGADESLRIVAVTVIGGAGTVVGAVLGAVFVLGVPAIFGDTTIAGLLPSGIGLLVLALVFPGGLADVARRGFARFAPSRRVAPGPAQMPTAWTVKAASPGAPAGFAVRGLTVMFGGRVALDRIDLEIEPASIIGLIGPNGAGKTTLLDAVSGFVTPAAGTILMDDRPIGAMSPTARARAGIGRVLQDGRLFEDLTVAEAVMLAGRAGRGAALDAIDWLGIDADTLCQELPAGTRRLVELACSLLRQPRLLLLDEPTAGLGQADASSFAPLLSSIHEQLGCTVVLVEHDVALVGAVARRLVCLSAGAILADGPPAEVLAHPDVVVGYMGH